MTCVARYTRTSARARLPYTEPSAIPSTVNVANRVLCRQPMSKKIATPRRTSTTVAAPASNAPPRPRKPAIGEVSTLDIALVPEVAAADSVVGCQLRARAREHEMAGLEHVAEVGGLQREVRVLLDDEDGQTLLLVQLANDPEQLRHQD